MVPWYRCTPYWHVDDTFWHRENTFWHRRRHVFLSRNVVLLTWHLLLFETTPLHVDGRFCILTRRIPKSTGTSSYSPFVHGHRLGFLRQTHVRLLAVLHHFYLIISCSLHHPHYIPHHIVNYITLSQTYMVYPRKIPVYKSPIYIYIIHIYIYILYMCVCLC